MLVYESIVDEVASAAGVDEEDGGLTSDETTQLDERTRRGGYMIQLSVKRL
jgi:hypothetical protein